jgi:type VII secretion-associated serine protease mycosin
LTLTPRLAAVGLITTIAMIAASPVAWADSTRDRQWHLTFLNTAAAHQISQGEGILVGLPDTGVDAQHPDLVGATAAGTEIGESGDGRVDTDGHGTGMAGLIAGRGHGSGGGALGIAPRATILPVRTVRSEFGGVPKDLGEGITWAVEHGAKVICVAGVTSEDPTVLASISRALKADVVVVAGVGNTPKNTTVGYPARIPGVLAVGGVDQAGHHASISATGPEVAIVAPAVDIVSTAAFGQYRTATGTSDATAIVAGAAALVRAKYPNLTAPDIIHRLTTTATDKGPPGRDPEYGYGTLDLLKALTADIPTTTPRPTTPPPNAQPQHTNHTPTRTILTTLGALTLAATAAAILIHRRRRA